MTEPSFTIGIEEEYHLVDRATRELAAEPPPSLMDECKAELDAQVSPEFLRTQIEVGTRVCTSLAEARTDLARLRATVRSSPQPLLTKSKANFGMRRRVLRRRSSIVGYSSSRLARPSVPLAPRLRGATATAAGTIASCAQGMRTRSPHTMGDF